MIGHSLGVLDCALKDSGPIHQHPTISQKKCYKGTCFTIGVNLVPHPRLLSGGLSKILMALSQPPSGRLRGPDSRGAMELVLTLGEQMRLSIWTTSSCCQNWQKIARASKLCGLEIEKFRQ